MPARAHAARRRRASGATRDPVGAYAEARSILGQGSIVGVDAGISRHDAMTVAEEGADYVAFGAPAYLKDRDKARARRDELIAWWAEIFQAPCVAFDVETAEEAHALAGAGADFVSIRLSEGTSPAGRARIRGRNRCPRSTTRCRPVEEKIRAPLVHIPQTQGRQHRSADDGSSAVALACGCREQLLVRPGRRPAEAAPKKAPQIKPAPSAPAAPPCEDHQDGRVPVIAAGGIADERGIAAAFMLGASGVQMGTAYLFCPEANVSPLHRQALRRCRMIKTVLTTSSAVAPPARSSIGSFANSDR